MSDQSELRSYERYVLSEALTGSFGSAEVRIIDLGEQGAQIEHALPLRVATVARFWFKRGEVAVSVQALVVWSRLSKHKSADGKLLYRTGLRVEEGAEDFSKSVAVLAEKNLIHRDSQSLERKRKLREEREMAKSASPTMRRVPMVTDVPPDQALLIEHARERLKANPDEAQKWYSRAYFAIRQGQTPLAAELTRYREDVLAVWEYLERSVPLSVISRVFEKKG
jgi:hypothetical protein